MLEDLAKKDSYWRSIALRICKDKYLADDLVNDMYLKLANSEKQINDFYVIIVLRNLFIDHTKQKRLISIDELYNLSQKENFEIDDNEKDLIDSLEWWEKDLIELSYDNSLRELATKLNINYAFIYRVIKKARNGKKK
jgi:DNA-directed RNA polymerase specialized sigma24 family protein